MLVWNELEVVKFKEVLPEIERDEVLIMFMMARKKYGFSQRSHKVFAKAILKNKDEFVDYVKRFDAIQSTVSHIYPPDSVVMYVDLLPKSTIKAFNLLVSEGTGVLISLLNQEEKDFGFFRNIDDKLFSAIHKSHSRKPYLIIDIDEKNEDLLRKVIDVVGEYVVWVSETRGGYHVIVKRVSESSSKIFNEIRGGEKIEVHWKNVQTPIPGTKQGGFMVRGINY